MPWRIHPHREYYCVAMIDDVRHVRSDTLKGSFVWRWLRRCASAPAATPPHRFTRNAACSRHLDGRTTLADAQESAVPPLSTKETGMLTASAPASAPANPTHPSNHRRCSHCTPENQRRTHAHLASKAHPNPSAAEVHADPTQEAHADPTPEVHADPTQEAHADPTPEVHADPTPEAYPYPAPEVHADPAPEAYPYPTPEAYPYPTPEAYPYPTPEAYPYPTPEAYPYPAHANMLLSSCEQHLRALSRKHSSACNHAAPTCNHPHAITRMQSPTCNHPHA